MSSFAPIWGIENLGMAALCISAVVLILAALQQYRLRWRHQARRRQLHEAASQRVQQQRRMHPPGEPLPAAVRASLKSVSFRASESRLDDVTCPICLVEYEDHEQLLSLPCKHSFHADCVGLWFDAHSTCPFCRHALHAPPDIEAGPRDAGAPAAERPAPPEGTAASGGAAVGAQEERPLSGEEASSGTVEAEDRSEARALVGAGPPLVPGHALASTRPGNRQSADGEGADSSAPGRERQGGSSLEERESLQRSRLEGGGTLLQP